MNHIKLGRGVLLAAATLLPTSSCVLTTEHKPATPLISGPDTGWTRAPVLFEAHNSDSGVVGGIDRWTWGDGAISSGQPYHEYTNPGTYIVTCQVWTQQQGWPLEPEPVGSDPSVPCTLHIIQDTMVFPDTVIDTVAIGAGAHWACILPSGLQLYVTNAASGTVSVIDTRTNVVTGTVPVGTSPTCCLSSNSGQYVYVSDSAANMVSVIRTSDNTVVNAIQVPAGPGRLAISPDDSLLYVAQPGGNLLSVVRTRDDSCVAQVPVSGGPTGVAVKPGGEYVWVTCRSSDSVAVVRVSDNVIVAHAPAGAVPSGILFSPAGETAYVACESSHCVTLLSTSDYRKLDSTVIYLRCKYLTTAWPYNLLMLPGNHCIYAVANSAYGCVINILRRSDNYRLRLMRFDGASAACALPDGSRAYVPASAGVIVLGLRRAR